MGWVVAQLVLSVVNLWVSKVDAAHRFTTERTKKALHHKHNPLLLKQDVQCNGER